MHRNELSVLYDELGQLKIIDSGIGLVIAENVIELLGGNHGIESSLNKGSIFWVVLECLELLRKLSTELVIAEIPTAQSVK